MEKKKEWRECKLKQKKGNNATKPESFYSESFLIGPDLGTVGKGSALCMQQEAMSPLGLSLASPIWAIQVSSAEKAW